MTVSLGILATAQIPQKNSTGHFGDFPKEIVRFAVNSNILMAGELLQYKVFNLTADFKKSTLSKIVYVSLRNEADSVVFSHKLQIENGSAQADFFIPATVQTGVYRLIGYTNFSRNNPRDAYFEEAVYILNTFIKPSYNRKTEDTISVTYSAKQIEDFERASKPDEIQIFSNKKIYGPRDKVEIKLESPEAFVGGDYILSVRKLSPVENMDAVAPKQLPGGSEIFFIPEIRGEIISGTIRTQNGEPLANKEVSLTIPGNDFIFKIARTNENGRFFFSVAEKYDAEKGIVQIIEAGTKSVPHSVVMDSKDFKGGLSIPKFLKLDPSLKNWLQERSLQVQVENAYFDIKKDSILRHSANQPFYENLGTVFLLDDYTRFPTVRETFVEVINLASIRGSGENATFSVNNAYDPNGFAKFNDIAPLVLMDGIQIQDNQYLIDFNARDIESIRVIAQPYRYGPKIFSGIISVKTKSNNFVPSQENYQFDFALAAPEKKKLPYRVDYSKPDLLSRIPDYRVQLLWKTDVSLNLKNAVEFYTSDVLGTFEIVLMGYSAEGAYVEAKAYFQVEKN